MIESFLHNLDKLLLGLFGLTALVTAASMLVLRHPMQVAIALIATMISLAVIYGMLGVHFIAAFQVLIYVSAVMVFMVYVIMLLDVRDASFRRRFSVLLVPGIAGGVLLLAVLAYAFWHGAFAPGVGSAEYGMQRFAVTFLNDYWLHFELTSVLLLAAVVAAMAIIKVSRKTHG